MSFRTGCMEARPEGITISSSNPGDRVATRLEEQMNILDHTFIKGDDLMARSIAGETLIVPIRGHVGDLNAIYTLNEVGSTVWQLIDASTPIAKIVEAITAEYEVTAEEAARDVVDLIHSMQAAGLIRPALESEA